MSKPEPPRRQRPQQQEWFSKEEVEEEVRKMQAEARSILAGLRAENARLTRGIGFERRVNEQSGDQFDVLSRYNTRSSHTAIWLMLQLDKRFSFIRNFAEFYNTPVRNWLQIFVIAAILSTGFVMLIPDARAGLGNWYNSSPLNSYILFVFILIIIGLFFFVRRRSLKTTQTA